VRSVPRPRLRRRKIRRNRLPYVVVS